MANDYVLTALKAAAPRPIETASRKDKKNYAERFSREMSTCVANSLRHDFRGITPDPNGGRQEWPARSARGLKKLDVNYSTPELGLGLGVSIKTINFIDRSTKRFTKNYSRNDNELRAEAKDYHERQPYAVLVAVIMLPVASTEDGKTGASSFGAAVQYFKHRGNRHEPRDEAERFERVFVGLYDPDLDAGGCRGFWDVSQPPPQKGMPSGPHLLTWDQMIGEITRTYDARNRPPVIWADGSDSTAPEDLFAEAEADDDDA
ncbi:MAG: hypothetical protein Phyf2KO_16880 [Phycisphaerales bacterium]